MKENSQNGESFMGAAIHFAHVAQLVCLPTTRVVNIIEKWLFLPFGRSDNINTSFVYVCII